MEEETIAEAPQEETQVETQTEDQIIKQFEKEKKQYEQSSQEARSEITDIYNAYLGKMDEVQSTPYNTKETMPKLRTEIAYVKPFILSGQPSLIVDGVGDEDKALSKVLEKIINYRLEQSIPNAYEKIEAWVHQAVTFGTSVIRPVWKFETKQEVGEDGEVFETPIVDEPDLEIPNILDTYKNPMIPTVKGQASFIFRSVLTSDDVKKNPAYTYQGLDGTRNADKVEGKAAIKSNPFDSTAQLSSQVLTNQDGMVEIYERVTADRLQTISIGKETLVLRDVENPDGCINAVKLLFEPNTIPNVFDGLGVGQNTISLGKSYYKMWNQTLTNVKMTNNPMFMFKKGARIDKKQLVSKPGGGIEVDGDGNISDDIVPVQFPDIQNGAIELLNKIEDEHQRASGANDLLQGAASNSTLGQDEMAQANVSNRFELIVRRFKHALSAVAKILIDMEIRNLQSPDAEILRIFPDELPTGQIDPMTGEEIMQPGARQQIFLMLKNEAPDIKFNISVRGDTTLAKNKNLESKRLVDLFDLAQNFLTDQEKRAFLRRIAEKQGEDNIDEIIQENNPMADQQEQMMGQEGQNPQGEYNTPGEITSIHGLNNQTDVRR